MLGAEGQLEDKSRDEHRQNEDAKDHQKAEEKLAAASGIFQRLPVDMDTTPDMAPDIGLCPEAVDRQGDEGQQEIDRAIRPSPGLSIYSMEIGVPLAPS